MFTAQQLAELAAIEARGRAPIEPERQKLIDELFDHGLLIIYPGDPPAYGLSPDGVALIASHRLSRLGSRVEPSEADCPHCGGKLLIPA